jgi:hypothetical protein
MADAGSDVGGSALAAVASAGGNIGSARCMNIVL